AAKLHLSALEADRDVAITELPSADGRADPLMAVNGVATTAKWPDVVVPPAAFRVDRDRFLIEDRYRDRILLWDRSQRVLTDAGRGFLVVAPGLGRMVLGSDDEGRHVRWLEVDPDRPALRELWAPQGDQANVVIGTHRGAPLVAELSA